MVLETREVRYHPKKSDAHLLFERIIVTDFLSFPNMIAGRQTTNFPHKRRKKKDVEIPIFLSSHQLMNELFPAEWFPMSMMVIFFLGANSFRPSSAAAPTRLE